MKSWSAETSAKYLSSVLRLYILKGKTFDKVSSTRSVGILVHFTPVAP